MSMDTLESRADRRNRQVLEQARQAGLVGAPKTARISGRVAENLLVAARQRAHVTSDTELIEIALARLALEDDFGVRLVRRKGALPKGMKLEF